MPSNCWARLSHEVITAFALHPKRTFFIWRSSRASGRPTNTNVCFSLSSRCVPLFFNNKHFRKVPDEVYDELMGAAEDVDWETLEACLYLLTLSDCSVGKMFSQTKSASNEHKKVRLFLHNKTWVPADGGRADVRPRAPPAGNATCRVH